MFYNTVMTSKPIPASELRRHNGKVVLTAKDVASAIAFTKDRQGFPKALRQVKHWTDKGLLQAITDLDTGSGVAREYVDDPTVIIAAILQELVLFGWTVERLAPIAARLYDDFENGDPGNVLFGAMTDEFKGYLVLEFDVDNRGRLSLENARTFSTAPDEEPLEDSMPRSRSSLLIDLGAVASRIKWPAAKEIDALMSTRK